MNNSRKQKVNDKILEAISLQSPKVIEIKPGLNSSAYQLTDGKNKLFLKIYKDDADGLRLTRETYFLKAAEILGIENSPRIISANKELNFCALTWIEGIKIDTADTSDWKNQIEFIENLQKVMCCYLKDLAPYAADAFFTLADHRNEAVSRLKQSIKRIKAIDQALPVEYTESIEMLSNKLIGTTDIMLRKQVLNSRSELVVMSPSDIGFHNSLKSTSGCIFFDFEYAGIDDMYKLLADWCVHPDWQPPLNLITSFLDCLIEGNKREMFNPQRAMTMLHIYQIKWTSIILNSSNKVSELKNKVHYLEKAYSYIGEANNRFKDYADIFCEYT